jgi:uncharacterized protein (DUF2147 family)
MQAGLMGAMLKEICRVTRWAALLMAASMSAAAGTNDAGVEGYWKTPAGAIVHVHPCGSDVCLRIVKLSPIIPEKTDQHNPNEKLRNRSLCSLDAGTGFRQLDATHLADGHLYDPESGHTYSGTIVVEGDEMRLRGFIGIALFGRTEVWHRASPVAESDCR